MAILGEADGLLLGCDRVFKIHKIAHTPKPKLEAVPEVVEISRLVGRDAGPADEP